MPASDDLFDLIQSLSSSEKRYFRLFAGQQKGDSQYIQLFDAIDKLDKYDESKLLKRLKGNKATKNLATYKNRLFAQIMRALRLFHESSGLQIKRINRLLDEYRILYDRGLSEIAYKTLQRAKNLALETESYNHLQRILELERLDRIRYLPIDEKIEQTRDNLAQQLEYQGYSQSLTEYRQLWNEFSFIETQHVHARGPEEIAKVEEILNHPIITRNSEGLPKRLLGWKLNIQANCLDYLGRYHEAYEIKREDFESIGKHRLKTEPIAYLKEINNVVKSLLMAGKLDQYPYYRECMLAMKPRNEEEKQAFIERFYNFEFPYLFYTGKYQEAIQLAEEIEPELMHHYGRMDPLREIQLHYYIGTIYIKTQDYEGALRWFRNVDEHPRAAARQDIWSFSKIFLLLCHYELNNLDILPYQLRNTYRFLYGKERMFTFETILLAYLKKLSNTVDKEEINQLLQNFLTELEELKNDPIEQNVFKYYDFTDWLRQKLGIEATSEIK